MAAHGLKTIPTSEFNDPALAVAHVRSHPARYVLRFSGYDSLSSCVGCSPYGSDVVAMLQHLARRGPQEPNIIITPHIEGVHTGVGVYFTGKRFLRLGTQKFISGWPGPDDDC